VPADALRTLTAVRAVLALLTALVALAAASVAAGAGGGAPIPQKSFKLPGGNVTCVITGGTAKQAGVICTAKLAPGARPFPRKNCGGVGDSGAAILLGLTGKPKAVCLSENPFQPPIRTLAYGKVIAVGGISCAAISKAVGVRCENASARGFSLSTKGWKPAASLES
jgi:hypothetical protein